MADTLGHPDARPTGGPEFRCNSCGDPIQPARAELGYDYCLKEECQKLCLQPVLLASMGINKAADYYTRAEEVLPPRLPSTPPGETDPTTEATAAIRPSPAPREEKRHQSTIERLRRAEADLDRALELAYDRFCRAEITAAEMDRERDQLIESFNQVVRNANIRYRSLLRGPALPTNPAKPGGRRSGR